MSSRSHFCALSLWLLAALIAGGQATFVDGGLVIPLESPDEEPNTAIDLRDLASVRTIDVDARFPVISEETLARFGDYIAGLAQDYGIPGLSLAIVQGDEVVYQQTIGFANLKTGERITEETLFHIGPATQAMTSLLAATLEGQTFSYDKPVKKLWPRFQMSDRDLSGQVTLRHLLTMTAGIPDYTDNILDPAWSRPEDVLAVIAQAPVIANPGRRFNASLVSSAAGGYLLSRAAGRQGELYEDYLATMQEQIFTPLNMRGTTFSLEEAQATGKLASAHKSEERGRYDPVPFWQPEPNALAPAIGMKSNLRDMSQWLITELNQGVAPNGTRIALPLNVRERWQPARTEDSRNYGMGWTRRYYRGVEIIGTTGSYDRHTAAIAVFPGFRTGFVAMINADSPDAFKVLTELPLGIAEMLLEAVRQTQPDPAQP